MNPIVNTSTEAVERTSTPLPNPSGRRAAVARRILIIQGHPDAGGDHFGCALAQAYARGATEAGHDVEVLEIAKLEFPLLRSKAELDRAPAPEAIRSAQRALLRCDHVVLIYPVWNGGMPALLKGFLEQVFRPAFVFPDAHPEQPLGLFAYFTQKKGLQGKTARVVATMQMPAFVYRWYFHPHSEKNTLRLSGIGPVRESFIGLVHRSNGRWRERWLHRMHALGRRGR
jgi:putative NADPH-quinone reductase